MTEKRRITVLVSPEEHGLFAEAAYRERLSLSEWVRGAAHARSGGLVPTPGRVAGPVTLGPPVPPEAITVLDDLPPREVKAKRPKDGLCEHRVPAGTFCKKCGV